MNKGVINGCGLVAIGSELKFAELAPGDFFRYETTHILAVKGDAMQFTRLKDGYPCLESSASAPVRRVRITAELV